MLNKVMLIGRLGRDPETKTSHTGTPVAKFSLATDSKRNGEKTTEWHRCVAFQKTADLIGQLLRKGAMVYVEGRIRYDSYENKEGHKVTTTDIIVDTFQILSGREAQQPAQEEPTRDTTPIVQAAATADVDDLPF